MPILPGTSTAEQVANFAEEVLRRQKRIHDGLCLAIFNSVRFGSRITGAPGQPVQFGNLLASWANVPESEWVNVISSGSEYAHSIEEGQQDPYWRGGTMIYPKPMELHSLVGGFHSVKLTTNNWKALLSVVVQDVTRGLDAPDEPGGITS